MKRIIFLDVDGVLNSHIVAEEWHQRTNTGGYGGWFDEKEVATKENVKWGHVNVHNLREIIRATNAEIVISSDWRKNFSIDKFKEMFKLYGWNAPVIDRTPAGYSSRGLEVNTWLKDNPDIDSFVIIDDTDMFLAEQKPKFVNTDPEVGLTWKDANKAIEILLNH